MSKKHHSPPPKAIAAFDIRAEGSTAEVLIYDTIGEDFWSESITAKSFAKQVSELKEVKDINVRINSPGGSVFDATAIYNTLKNHPANITVTIEGMALSAASLVAMAGDRIKMASNAYMMIHNPWSFTEGDADAMRKAADLLDKIKGQLVKAYAERSQLDEAEVSAMLDAETWLTADEAVEKGFADEVMSQPAVAAHVDVKQFSKAPAAFKRMVKAQAKPMPTKEKPEMADEPKAASIGEIKAACEGATSDFVLTQIEKGATLPQALTAWTAVQAAELKKVKAELEEKEKEAEAKAKEEEEAKAKAMEEEEKAKAMEEEEKAKAKSKTKPGVKPVNNSNPVDTANGTARDQWNDLVNSFKVKHAPARAVSMAYKAAPELHAAMLAEVNAR